jgi:oligoendopeptidase F
MDTKTSRLKKRHEIDDKFKWDLESIYRGKEEWLEDFQLVKRSISDITNLKGSLSASSGILLNCLQLCDRLFSILDKVYVYARMKRDEDNTNPTFQELAEKASLLSTEVSSKVSFITPEILAIPEDKLVSFYLENEQLTIYKVFLNELKRQKLHFLSDREEELLGMANDISTNPKNIFTMYNNADIKFPFIKDEYENKVELTKGRYITFLESKNREVRKNAFKAIYKTYSAHKNTIASMLSGNVKCNKFYATARKYKSSLESALDADNVKTDVYDNLIETVSKNLPLLERYLSLRKEVMGLDKLHMYDLFVPLIKDPSSHINYETAVKMVSDGLTPLGDEYCNILKKAFNNRWIDVYENEGKTSGAYSWGCYLSHPYVLLNYQGKLNDVFTLAHEMGHALHSYYTNTTQPYIYSEYKIFVAEVASTCNESLLTSHLLKQSNKKEERAYILNHFLEEFRGTIFRQTMFAEFEKIIHSRIETGDTLGADVLCEIYFELNKKYYGKVVHINKDIAMEWARIPHFYNSFYVYKYATGMSCALSLSRQILEEGESAVTRYINFLKSGGSDYPLELLKKAGVDLFTPAPIVDAFKIFKDNLIKLEECF